jgi:hypothetical protein
MSMLKKLNIAIACAIVAMSPKISRAVDIFDTTGSSGISSALFFPPLWSGTLFRTTAANYVITSFSFQTNNTLGSMSGNLIAKIYSSSGSQPGTQVGANLGTIDTSTVSTTFSLTGLNFALQPSTNYWLVFDNTAVAGSTNFRFTITPSGLSAPFSQAQTSDAGGGWQVNTGVAMIGVITAVPEPGTVVLCVIGAGVLCYSGLRRRWKTIATVRN